MTTSGAARRAVILALALALLAAMPGGAAAQTPTWRLEQPPPPAGAPFKVPLGSPGDLSFWAPNRGLLTVEGNSTVPRGIFSWNGESWHQLATVCGGGGDSSRIAWAGPTEFWVVTEPSKPRAGAGLGLCHFLDGQVVGSYSTRVDAADPFRRMLSAVCNGPSDCWFGGVGSQDPLGERVGAFHLHWDGTDLSSVYGPQGRGVSDMEFLGGQLYESTLVGRGPENRVDPVDLAVPESPPSLLHEVGAGGFVNDPFAPAPLLGVPDDGTELLGLDSDGADLWAVGGGAASGPAAPSGGSVERPPLAAHLVGGSFQELTLTGSTFGATDRLTDVAAIPSSDDAYATVVPFADRASTNTKATVALIEPDGTTTATRLPVAGAGRGSAARIACTSATDCWLATRAGWLFHYTDGAPQTVDTDPAFQGTIEFRPNESAEQFVPDSPPVDDSQLFAPPEIEADEPPEDTPPKRRPPVIKHVKTDLVGKTRLRISFDVTRKARVQVLAKRHRVVVARSKPRVFGKGHHQVSLKLSEKRWPTGLAFKTKEIKRHHGGGTGTG